jgi:hypothetical protein
VLNLVTLEDRTVPTNLIPDNPLIRTFDNGSGQAIESWLHKETVSAKYEYVNGSVTEWYKVEAKYNAEWKNTVTLSTGSSNTTQVTGTIQYTFSGFLDNQVISNQQSATITSLFNPSALPSGMSIPIKPWDKVTKTQDLVTFSLGTYSAANLAFVYESKDNMTATVVYTIPQAFVNNVATYVTQATGNFGHEYHATNWAPSGSSLAGHNYYTAEIKSQGTINDREEWQVTFTNGVRSHQKHILSVDHHEFGSEKQLLHVEFNNPASSTIVYDRGLFENESKTSFDSKLLTSGNMTYVVKPGVQTPQTDNDWMPQTGTYTVDSKHENTIATQKSRFFRDYSTLGTEYDTNGVAIAAKRTGQLNVKSSESNGLYKSHFNSRFAASSGTITDNKYNSLESYVRDASEEMSGYEIYDLRKQFLTSGHYHQYNGRYDLLNKTSGNYFYKYTIDDDSVAGRIKSAREVRDDGTVTQVKSDVGHLIERSDSPWLPFSANGDTVYSTASKLEGPFKDHSTYRDELTYGSRNALIAAREADESAGIPHTPATPTDYIEFYQTDSQMKLSGYDNATSTRTSDYDYTRTASDLITIDDYKPYSSNGTLQFSGGLITNGNMTSQSSMSLQRDTTNTISGKLYWTNSSGLPSANRSINSTVRNKFDSQKHAEGIRIEYVGGHLNTKYTSENSYSGQQNRFGSDSWELHSPHQTSSTGWETISGTFNGQITTEEIYIDDVLTSGRKSSGAFTSGEMKITVDTFKDLTVPTKSEGYSKRHSVTKNSGSQSRNIVHDYLNSSWQDTDNTSGLVQKNESEYESSRSLTTFVFVQGSPPPGSQSPSFTKIGNTFEYDSDNDTSLVSTNRTERSSPSKMLNLTIENEHNAVVTDVDQAHSVNNGNTIDSDSAAITIVTKKFKETYDLAPDNVTPRKIAFNYLDEKHVNRVSSGLTSGSSFFSESKGNYYHHFGTKKSGEMPSNYNSNNWGTSGHVNYTTNFTHSRNTDSPNWSEQQTVLGNPNWDMVDLHAPADSTWATVLDSDFTGNWVYDNAGNLLRITFGVVDVLVGSSATLFSGGLGAAGGLVAITLGLDQIITGVHNIRTGSSGQSVVEFGGYWAARNIGGFSENTSQWIGILTPVVLGVTSGLGSASGILNAAKASGIKSASFWVSYISSRQRSILLSRVAESRSLSEAKGIVYAAKQLNSRGYLLVDASLQYSGNKGIDLLFKRVGIYATAEAKAGDRLSLLRTYGGLRQGSDSYNASRLMRYLMRGNGQNNMLVEHLFNNVFNLESFASFYRGKLLYELPHGWPILNPILR